MTFWNNPINFIGYWLNSILTGWHLPAAIASVLLYVIGIIVLILFAMTLDIGLVWVERKVVARFQDRLGPNRIGPFGLIQPIADIIKMVIKEDITPTEQIRSSTTCPGASSDIRHCAMGNSTAGFDHLRRRPECRTVVHRCCGCPRNTGNHHGRLVVQ